MAKNIKITKDPLSIDKRTNSRLSHFLKVQLHKPLVGYRKVDLQCLTKIVSFYSLMQYLHCQAEPLETLLPSTKNLKITKGPQSTDKISKLFPSCFIKIAKESPTHWLWKGAFTCQTKTISFCNHKFEFLAKLLEAS